jgi:hypothetical protein
MPVAPFLVPSGNLSSRTQPRFLRMVVRDLLFVWSWLRRTARIPVLSSAFSVPLRYPVTFVLRPP